MTSSEHRFLLSFSVEVVCVRGLIFPSLTLKPTIHTTSKRKKEVNRHEILKLMPAIMINNRFLKEGECLVKEKEMLMVDL